MADSANPGLEATAAAVRSNALVAAGTETVNLSSMLAPPATGHSGEYLILNGLDRDEYPVGYNPAAMGHVSGNGTSLGFTLDTGDAYTFGAVFTWDAGANAWWNPTLGWFNQLSYITGGSAPDTANIALYTTGNAGQAQQYASHAYDLAANPALFDYAGSAGFSTVAAGAGVGAAGAGGQATPGGVANAALTTVGQVWNDGGCWTLASIIADEAGAALPVGSTLVGVTGQHNGEWVVAYDGTQLPNANWASNLRPGDMVNLLTAGGTGHITTVVSGTGAGALLVDNATFTNPDGTVQNSAHDGVGSDMIIASPHPAYQEFAGADDSNVVVYRLDTPMVTLPSGGTTLASVDDPLNLAPYFLASPALPGESVSQWQVYDTASNGSFDLNGASLSAHDATDALTLGSLAGLALQEQAAGNDTVEARAFNGSFWGDWAGLGVTTLPTATMTG